MTPAVQSAIVRQVSGTVGALHIVRVPVPRPRPGSVLVRTRACCLGSDEPSAAMSTAGEVVLVGAGVTEWSRGDRVVLLTAASEDGMVGADFVVASAADLHALPAEVSFVSAASVAPPFAAAWRALFGDGHLGMGEPIVVIGAFDPVALATVQIGRWRNSRIVVVADGHQAPRLRALGADLVVSPSAPDLAHHVRAGLDGPAALVLDVAGGPLQPTLTMLGRDGRLVLLASSEPQPVDVDLIVAHGIRIIGSRSRFDTVDIDHILKLLGDGTFVPVIDSIHPFSRASWAARRQGSPDRIGSVMLVPDSVFESS